MVTRVHGVRGPEPEGVKFECIPLQFSDAWERPVSPMTGINSLTASRYIKTQSEGPASAKDTFSLTF